MNSAVTHPGLGVCKLPWYLLLHHMWKRSPPGMHRLTRGDGADLCLQQLAVSALSSARSPASQQTVHASCRRGVRVLTVVSGPPVELS